MTFSFAYGLLAVVCFAAAGVISAIAARNGYAKVTSAVVALVAVGGVFITLFTTTF